MKSNLKPEKKEDKEESKIPLGGFSPRKFEVDENDDLNVPTIFRVKGSNKKMLDDDPSEQTGFRFDQFDAFENEEVEETKTSKNDDDDSSSFLRMMMD